MWCWSFIFFKPQLKTITEFASWWCWSQFFLHYKPSPAAAEEDPDCVFHTAVQSENGGSGVCCSSAVKGLQRCREGHAELPEPFDIHTPQSLSARGPLLHTRPRHRCWMWAQCLKNTHVLTCTRRTFSPDLAATQPTAVTFALLAINPTKSASVQLRRIKMKVIE